jgi:Ca-activated chloride channel family protein
MPLVAMAANHRAPSQTAPGTFRTGTAVVFVPVSVLDSSGRPVLTLERRNFQVTENNRPQKVSYFAQDNAPISIAIVADLSNSMARKVAMLRDAVTRFLNAANEEDEFCLVELRDRAELVHDFGASAAEIRNELDAAQARGHTALLDGMYLALHQMSKAHHSRKALLVISDSGDNHSRFSAREVKDLAVESDTAIYAIQPPGQASMWSPEESNLLEDLADRTGGHDYTIEDQRGISEVVQRIGMELRNQYMLGYAPTELAPDGKYHQVHVKVVLPPGGPKVSVYWRRGYYAPRD